MATIYDSSNTEDDFELVNGESPPEYMSMDELSDTPPDISVKLQSVSESNEFLLSIHPPNKPHGELKHTSCDIVLVIDVSGSMSAVAELPDQTGLTNKEVSGLSILDLVKHASRTILEKLNENDRLAVVTFSSKAKVIQDLLPMTTIEKGDTWKRIEELTVHDSTNLWAGIREGLSILERDRPIGNVQSMFILTDGVPNYMCPSQGYVKKLQPMLKKMRDEKGIAPTLSTFGFGYHLRSSLMRSIAEVGRGNYAFIPDAGMIGTVFVHAVANLFSTFAANVEIYLECSDLEAKITFPSYLEFDSEDEPANKRILFMNNVQYGQTRNVIFKLDNAKETARLRASVRFNISGQSHREALTSCDLRRPPMPSEASRDYHVSRHELCTFLFSLNGRNSNNEYTSYPASLVNTRLPELESLIRRIEARLGCFSESCRDLDITNLTALLADLKSSDPSDPHGSGQVSLALNTETPSVADPPSVDKASSNHRYVSKPVSYYARWGTHYLPSVLHAHMRQICLTFKDPGPLRYSVNSPLFIHCRNELDNAFDELPPPKPSLVKYTPAGGQVSKVKMGRYHSSRNPCFSGQCLVRMGTEEDNVFGMTVEELRVGDFVWTPAGIRAVEHVVKTDVKLQMMCNVGGKDGLWITPWHPIHHQGQWVFPNDVTESQKGGKMTFGRTSVYSIMLENDADPNAHILEVGGVRCVTLGHGLTDIDGGDDVRNHPFFGDYNQVAANLEKLEKDCCGRRISGGIVQIGIENGTYALAAEFVKPVQSIPWFTELVNRTKSRL